MCEIMSLVFFGLAIVCRAISELSLHSKLRWSKGDDSFWGEESYYRKYANSPNPPNAPKNFYYKYIARVKYRERWFTSTWLTVFLTDGMHLCQFLYHIFFALGIWQSTDYPFLIVWPCVVIVHALTYRLLSR